jgi:hypothetical protein
MNKNLIMKKYIIGASIVLSLLFVGCGKKNETDNSVSTAMLINAASGNSISLFVVDGVPQNSTALTFRSATTYLNVATGVRDIAIRSNNAVTPVQYSRLSSENFADNAAYTYALYDDLLTPTSPLKTVKFNDDLTDPGDGFIKIRMLHLAKGGPSYDVTYLRTSNVLPVLPDSVTVSNVSYIGSSPSANDIANMEKFVKLPAGVYTIRLKIPGTQTAVASIGLNPVFGGVRRGIYTIYATGSLPTVAPLAFGLVRNLPN